MARHYIRLFASTDESPVGLLAVEYVKALLRIAPVRLCSMSGELAGRWSSYAPLLITPMIGMMVNVVCCNSTRWTWQHRMPVPRSNGVPLAPDAPAEIITGRVELYTAGVRNTLIACSWPTDEHEVAAGLRYDGVVVPTAELYDQWAVAGADPRYIPVPVTDQATLHGVVMP